MKLETFLIYGNIVLFVIFIGVVVWTMRQRRKMNQEIKRQKAPFD